MEDSTRRGGDRLDADIYEHLERISDAVFAVDPDFHFTYLNSKATELLDRDADELIGETIWDEFPDAIGSTFQEQYERAFEEKEPVTFTEYYTPLDKWFEVSAYPSETGLTVYFRDVTDRRKREERLERQQDRLDILETFTQVISEVSSASENAVSRDHIEQLVCNRLIETTPLRFVWVGRVDGDDIEPSAWAGAEQGSLEELPDDKMIGRGPAKRAAAENEVQITSSIEDSSGWEQWRAEALEHGFNACACVPLEYRGANYGVLCLYSDRKGAFGTQDGPTESLQQLGDAVTHAIDTVERRQEERELKRRREEFSTFVEDVEEYAIFRLDADGHIASWNRGAEDIEGYKESEVLGEHFSLFYTESEIEDGHPSEVLETARRDGQCKDEGWRVRKDGSQFWASVTLTALKDEDGSCRGFVKVIRDMTERKRRERRLDAVFNRTFQLMGLMKPDGTVLKVNDAAIEFSGVEREKLVGKHLWEETWWDANQENVDEMKDAIRLASTGEFVRYEVTGEDPDTGEEFVMDFSITPVTDERGEVVLLVPEGRDITERKQRERELRRERKRLEFMNRILRHNLLNGLNVVSARSEILQDFVDDAGRSHLTTVRERVGEMVDLVETMRSFTKAIVDSESHELKLKPLGKVLVRELERLDDDNDEVMITTDGAIPDVVVVADDLLPQVFENVLSNAVQHNDKAVPRVSVSVEQRGDGAVAVRIADNGPGIPDEEKQRIVEKDVEGLATPGSGFGLYLVKELVDSYGGTIDVSDNDPEGAVFTITLQTT
ncbi:PAS domain S-box protein [Halogeometricum borinquense]|uniref:PAS domain S-box protein n=1 Tax=Halogeometricum borinquense TaxID=60847 RepID=A0A6C0UFU7_9EURY|nr:PAS domain S-box protein [Halogeometricum borinquense]QIB74090.1 PAS domain S-box protein [Halogeometricum borinquense]QIQ76703.1 PAS domain S-box protein [Halogeometricum borinquense]